MKNSSAQDQSTKELLLETGIEFFGKYGYEGTSTRMIASHCGISVSTLAFHFGNKDGLYNAVLSRAAQQLDDYYRPFSTKVYQYLSGNIYTEKTWALIDEYFDLILNSLHNKDYHPIIYLIYREQISNPKEGSPLTDIAYQHSERMLVDLIQSLRPDLDPDIIAIYSRFQTGGIISLASTPIFLRRALRIGDQEDFSEEDWVKMKQVCISSVRRFVNDRQD